MPRPKDKKFLTTEDQERIDDIRLARQNNRLRTKNQRKNKLRRLLPIKPQNTKGRFQQKLQASNRAFDRLQTREAPIESNPDRRLLPKTLSGLGGGGRRARQVSRAAIKDIKWAAKNAGPIADRGVVEDGDTVRFKKGGKKKKKMQYQSEGIKKPTQKEFDGFNQKKKERLIKRYPNTYKISSDTPSKEELSKYKEGGAKKKKALKKATATYKSGGFLEPHIEEI